MKVKKKQIAISMFFALLSAFFCFSCLADEIVQEEPAAVQEEPAINLKDLEIIDFDDKIENGKIVKVYYYLGQEAESEKLYNLNEIERSAFYQKFYDKKTDLFYLKINSAPFFKKQNGWYQIESATTTLTNWRNQAKKPLIKTAAAATISPFATNDGWIVAGDSDWESAHDAINGADSYTSALFSECLLDDALYSIARSFLTFDTSALPDIGAHVVSSTVFLRGTAKIGTDSTALSGVGDYSSLGISDFGKVNSSVLSEVKTAAAFSTAGYTGFKLNATGTSTISLTGNTFFSWRNYNHDILNSACAAEDSATARSSAYAGTASDPYMVITYFLLPTSSPGSITATNTTNIFEVKKWTKNGTTYYNIPALLLFYILLLAGTLLFLLKKIK